MNGRRFKKFLQKRSFQFILVLIIVGVFGYAAFSQFVVLKPRTDNSDKITITEIHTAFDHPDTASPEEDKMHILIVPGHEPNYGGTHFLGVYERDIVVELADDLQKFLDADPKYATTVTRDTKAWSPVFSDYFKTDWNDIVSWERTAKKVAAVVKTPGEKSVAAVEHITVPQNVALRLYGITKWANDHNTDLMIHIHLNDDPDRRKNRAGAFTGIVIYTPARQYDNSAITKSIADAIFKRLTLYDPVSDLPQESKGLIDDPELIAVGANNTADSASILIEYGYIYEPQFMDPKIRHIALNDLAYKTYLGLQDFFKQNSNVTASSYYVPSVVYDWNTPVSGTKSDPKDIYALQTALIMDGDFPAKKNSCPHSGVFGPCTKTSLQTFQKKYGLSDNGNENEKTFALLRQIYSGDTAEIDHNTGLTILHSTTAY